MQYVTELVEAILSTCINLKNCKLQRTLQDCTNIIYFISYLQLCSFQSYNIWTKT